MTSDNALILSNVDFGRLIGKRILITGGSGFIGSWLAIVPGAIRVKRLNQLQYEYGDWYKQDWDLIIHLAPPSPERVIDCARHTGAMVFYASSGAIYDQEPGEYALGKLRGEHLLLDSGLNVKIARMYSFIGPHMRNHFAVINYIMDALSGGPIKIRGDNVTRTYLYAADMAIWIWRLILDGQPGSIYEIGGETPITMHDLAVRVAGVFTPAPPIIEERIFGPDARPNYVPCALDVTRSLLQVREYTPFEEALRKTVAYYADQLSSRHYVTYTAWPRFTL